MNGYTYRTLDEGDDLGVVLIPNIIRSTFDCLKWFCTFNCDDFGVLLMPFIKVSTFDCFICFCIFRCRILDCDVSTIKLVKGGCRRNADDVETFSVDESADTEENESSSATVALVMSSASDMLVVSFVVRDK